MKIKPMVYIVAFLFLSSCSRSIYYAFEEKGTYCTFEVNKKEIIYRAVSEKHYKLNSYPTKDYVYINSFNHWYEHTKPEIGKGALVYYLKKIESYTPYMCNTSTSLQNDADNFLFYSKTENTDSLELILKKELVKNEKCFTEHKITWFPPYLKKVKKIDYKKFNLPLKKKYLKTMADKDK
ncbi:hypothetical protein ACSTS3_18110 [Aquimarina muelleri]|uniref:hypothetical protein n=1 Tax=Aquimarina muelleri TaxID=279356 RepID=UPI003F6886C6